MNVRHVSAALLAVAALMVSASACDSKGPASPTAVSGPAECPSTFAFNESPGLSSTKGGELVPAGAETALLCVYPFNTGDNAGVFRLGRTLPATESPDRVTGYLNGLAEFDPQIKVSCTMMGTDQYQIALGYPGGTHMIVRVDRNCGKVSAKGATRRLEHVDTLLALWPRPEATG
ncbi:hypothetical protein [Dactylosporangium sucinum]|uniref:hypothetical protein n=1 Tax=Dactylosporangium sucinum TaxID=1424081 RepID=UPI00167D17A3|nr:hypothetical protein [Dactylosporangium sucinum]